MTRWTLAPGDIPSAWFNVAPHLPSPLQPPLHPATREPLGADDLAPLFPATLIEQEMTQAPWVDVPGEVLDVLRLWRPTPLVRATRLERVLDTPARIYFKDESGSPAGSHKPNTAVAQAFYNARDGVRRLTTETGAGQWGAALAFACAQFDLECMVYMVRASFEQKPYRRVLMETWGRLSGALSGRRT
jgi:tryptophan synthase beta chain